VTLVLNTGKCTADHVILAIPPYSLRAVRRLPDDIRALRHAALRLPLLQCFFVVNTRFSLKSHRQSGTSNQWSVWFRFDILCDLFFNKNLGGDTLSSWAGAPFNPRLGKEEEYV
jgi:hypothetical protein